jgi:hypothetical protein
MPGRPLDRRELLAAATVAVAMDGQIHPRDIDGAPERSHDFDVVAAGTRIALEVTTAADPKHASMEAVAYSRVFPAPGLVRTWVLGIPMGGGGDIRVKQVVKTAPAHLGVLEHHDRWELFDFDEWTLRDHPPAVAKAGPALRTLGLISAVAIEGGDPALWFAGHGGGTASPDRVNVLVRHEALENCAKLLAARADERHLFVWIVDVEYGGELAMQAGVLPSVTPELPPGIDVVWAASSRGACTWRCRPPEGWEALNIHVDGVTALVDALPFRAGRTRTRRR